MHSYAPLVALVVLAVVAPAVAGSADAEDSAVPRIAIDCAHPRLPPQHEVGALLGQHNLGQVYASRAALMAEARRACRRQDARPQRVVFERAPLRPSETRRMADNRRGE
jgi:hypothetical protein|nr:hypothetical protein [uncultured Pseudoxanthomonas sp.]